MAHADLLAYQISIKLVWIRSEASLVVNKAEVELDTEAEFGNLPP